MNPYILKHLGTKWVAGSLLSAVLLSSNGVMAESEAEYQQKLKELAQSIKTLNSELESARSAKSELQDSLQLSEEDIARLSKKISNIKEALAREKKHLAQLRPQRAELDKQKQAQQQAIAQTLRQAYQLGQYSKLKLLLNQEDPVLVSRLMQYHGYISAAHQQKIDAYQHTIAELNQVEQRVLASTQVLEQKNQRLLKQQNTLQQSRKQRLAIVKQLDTRLKRQGQKLAHLNKDRERLQALLDKVTQALAAITLPNNAQPFVKAKGRLPMPTQGKIVHRYGSSQFDGKLKRNGIVISSQAGANVFSVHHGRVVFSDYLRGHGLLLIIDHGDDYMSLYGHNQTLLKEIGEWTSPGDIIATVGDSGGQSQVGLYFEIRHKGQPQNPQTWLSQSS